MTGDCTILPLTAELTAQHLKALLAIDGETIGERWQSSHLMSPMPGKWELSRLALRPDGPPAGFLIASQKQESVHVHRLAVAGDLRGRGIGEILTLATAQSAVRMSLTTMTLKVARKNTGAIRFYQRLGFREDGRTHDNLVMAIALAELIKHSGSAVER